MCCLIPGLSLAGWKLKGNEFPASYQAQHRESLALRGVGVKTLFMMKVFLAGLYLPAASQSADALNPAVSKYLSVIFYAKFASKDFVDFTINTMKHNISKEEFRSLQTELKEISRVFPNIKSGDQFSMSYEAGIGTTFIHNGYVTGFIPGEVFSKALFSTWMGQKPFDYKIKNQILGLPSHPNLRGSGG